jgi:hypothetical protein
LEVLRYGLRRGRLAGRGELLIIAVPSLQGPPGLDEFLREYTAEEQRRQKLYPASL